MSTKIIKNRTTKWFLRKFTKLYKDYLPVSDIFEEPGLVRYKGSWVRDPSLPVWRQGTPIYIGKNWKNRQDVYNEKKHRWELQWTEEYKKKHRFLTWLFKKPVYHLPIWLAFYKFNHGMIWKTKFDEYRYEFPPLFSIVFFGRSRSYWLKHPKLQEKDGYFDENYWEPILYYTDRAKISGGESRFTAGEKCSQFANDIVEVGKTYGTYQTFEFDRWDSHYAMLPEFLKEPYKSEWVKYINEHPLDTKKKSKKTTK